MATRWRNPKDPPAGGDDPSRSPDTEARSIVWADETGKTRRALCDDLNNLFVKIRAISRLIWITDTDWNKGTVPATMEVNGTGDAAQLRLKALIDNDENIPFTTEANYELSDGAKLEVSGGQARLKAITGSTNDWPFTTPGNYTFNSSDVAVISGAGQLKSQAPADSTFYASYAFNINGNWGDGVLTGTATGGAAISGGFLDLTYEDVRYVSYASLDNFVAAQTGCLRFIVKPNYSGTPSTQQLLIDTNNGTDNNNRVVIWHATPGSGGGLFCRVASPSGVSIFSSESFGSFNPTAGVEYELEFNWDITTGASRLFVDGVQNGSTHTDTGNHNLTGLTTVRVGSNHLGSTTSNFSIKDVIVFATVQHTANYTPGASIPQTRYLETDPTIKNATGFAFSSVLNAFTETSIKTGSDEIKYQASSDNGTIFKWWDGGAWIARTITSVVTAVNTTVGTVDAGNLASLQTLDASTYDVSELGANPGFTIEMDMSNVAPAGPDNVVIWGYYDGTHTNVDVDIWDFNTTSWVTLGQLATSGGSVVEQSFAVTGSKSDKVEAGVVKIRINHDEMGNASHNIFLDYIYVDAPPSNEWWYDNESNTDSTINTNILTLAASGTFKFVAFLHSNDGTTTPELDNIFVSEIVTYSTDDNLYITTKDASQLNPTDFAAWLTTTITNSIPGSTDIRILFSVDDRVSWLTWSGSAWVAPASAVTRTDATALTDAVTNFAALPDTKPLDVRLFFRTTDNTVNPNVSNINVISDAGYETAGTYETNIVDSTILNLNWGEIGFSRVTPGGTTIIIKAKASNDITIMGSYGSDLADGADAGVVGQFIQFEIVMSGTALARPSIDWLSVQYVTPVVQDVAP